MIKKLEKEILAKLIKDNVGPTFVAIPINPKIKSKEKSSSYSSWGRRGENIFICAEQWRIKCSCADSKGEESIQDKPTCPYCGARLYNYSYPYNYNNHIEYIALIPPEIRKKANDLFKEKNPSGRGNWRSGKIYICKGEDGIDNPDSYHEISNVSRFQMFRTYYVREKLDGQVGIDMVRVTLNYATNDDSELLIDEKYDCFTEILPGKKITAYKYTKARGEEEISLFDAFHITSDNISEDENVYFEGASSMIDFMSANEEFSKRTGFINFLQNYKGNIPENSLFLVYMYLLSEYPVIELLSKMGYYGLIFGLFSEILNAYKRETIKLKVDELSSLLNQTNKGSAALSVPSYIVQFLNTKNADISEYKTWAAINEREPISKENFLKYISTEAYLYFNYYNVLRLLPNIMKYGYTLNQVSKYVMRQYFVAVGDKFQLKSKGKYGEGSFSGIVNMWNDYLQTCELLNVKPADMPKNLIACHDDAVAAYSALKNIETDAKLEVIAEQYSSYKTTSKYLDVVWPKNVIDFCNEGNEQHNCVAGYSQHVADGRCRIFFIRKRDQMDKSYITAECRKDGLGQLYYRNNQRVEDYTEIEYAKAICKYILSKDWEPDEKAVKKRIQEKRKK